MHLRVRARARARTHAHADKQARTRTRARTHTRTHIQISARTLRNETVSGQVLEEKIETEQAARQREQDQINQKLDLLLASLGMEGAGVGTGRGIGVQPKSDHRTGARGLDEDAANPLSEFEPQRRLENDTRQEERVGLEPYIKKRGRMLTYTA